MEIKKYDKSTYTVPEIAVIMGIGKNKAYELVKADGFPALFIGSTIRIPIKAFHEWLNSADGECY